ncbi:DNA-directed RNA polymerase III subunit RPC1, partial [Stegodyphus mimosarum]
MKGIKPQNIIINKKDILLVKPFVSSRGVSYYILQQLKEKLPLVVIKGISTVSRALIHKDGTNYELHIEGDGLGQ